MRSSVVDKVYVNFCCDAGDGKIVLKEDEHSETNGDMNGVDVKKAKKRNPVDIELDVVLGKMPKKVRELLLISNLFVYSYREWSLVDFVLEAGLLRNLSKCSAYISRCSSLFT